MRPDFHFEVLDIASTVASAERSTRGSMVSSSETTSYHFLDGGVRETRGFFGASSGVFVSGDKCLQYVLHKLGYDPAMLLEDGAVIYPLSALEKEIRSSKHRSRKG